MQNTPKNRYITVGDDGSVSDVDFIRSIARGDKIHWLPETDETQFTITFKAATPVDFRKKPNEKGKPLVGNVNECVNMDDRFEYQINPAHSRSGPELIVDGGRPRKHRRKGAKRANTAKRPKR